MTCRIEFVGLTNKTRARCRTMEETGRPGFKLSLRLDCGEGECVTFPEIDLYTNDKALGLKLQRIAAILNEHELDASTLDEYV